MEHTDCTIKREKLRKASDALYYEVSMLRATAYSLASGIFDGCETPIRNAIIESFAVHVRVLIEFFYLDKEKKDTILAKHFFSLPDKWEKIRPPETKVLIEAKKHAHKLLAHLTYSRLKENMDKRWPVTEIMKDIEKVLDCFLQKVPKELLVSRLKTKRELKPNEKN